MTTPQTRIPAIPLADDGSPGADDIIDVSAQISNPIDLLANGVGLFHVSTKANLPVTQLFRGRQAICDDTGAIYRYDGGWIFLQDTQLQTYTPTWTAANSAPSLGNGTLTGRYFRVGRKVKLFLDMSFGSTTNGGTGNWSFTIPSGWTTTQEHKAQITFYAAANGWDGSGICRVVSGPGFDLYGPRSNTDVRMDQPLRNTDSSGAGGTGIPYNASFPFTTGSNIHAAIEFEVNSATLASW